MDVEVVNQATSLISTVGFPIFVAIYMLTKGTRDNKELKESVNQLTIAVTQQTELFKMMKKGD